EYRDVFSDRRMQFCLKTTPTRHSKNKKICNKADLFAASSFWIALAKSDLATTAFSHRFLDAADKPQHVGGEYV
ncbi:MAG: hypothetical protein WBE18_01395, partial [Gammaproteobacteria bacterium]